MYTEPADNQSDNQSHQINVPYPTHGIFEGIIAWTKYDKIIITSPDREQIPTNITIVQFQEGRAFQITGQYSFRIGARYRMKLINGLLVTAVILTSK